VQERADEFGQRELPAKVRAAAAPNVNLREDNSNAGYRMGKTNIGKLEINRDSFGWRSYQPA
jgi:hypothetical protein